MHKFLFVIFLATCVSCTHKIGAGEDSVGREISFSSPIVGIRTKALDDFSTNNDFCVVAKYYDNEFTTWSAGIDYFGASGSKVVYNSSWKTSPNTYYWPKAGSLSFQAYAPHTTIEGNTIVPISPATEIIGTNGVTAEVTLNSAKGQQIDFLYSERVINQNGNIDHGHFYGVQIPFHHALAKVSFQAMLRSHLPNESDYFKITSISLKGLKTTGIFTQGLTDETGSGAKTAGAENGVWDPWNVSGEAAGNYENVVLDSEGYKVSGTLPDGSGFAESFVIPQELLEGFEIEISYEHKSGGADPVLETGHITSAILAGEDYGISDFAIGKQYVFTLIFGEDNKIYFEPKMRDWADQDLSGDIHYSF